MSWAIKWCICCILIIFLGLGFLIGTYVTLTVHVVQDQVAEYHRTNLLLLYEIRED
jgi:uncharacterized membrane protein